ncbi:DUF2972 domain-containing protein [Campylobacter coli]|nr:DUF2972 domain-containing protein [Campylobacter coli]
MKNSNSAIERIKNHLAYKLGQAMIDFSKNRESYILLFKKLYWINKQHKKDLKIYKQTIQIFPQLKYPKVEMCNDYKQALKYKFHLSYMLGEVLINTYQTWYKGGVFKLKSDIKRTYKEFLIFRQLFDKFEKLEPNIFAIVLDNKQILLNKFDKINNILQMHQGYQAILDNIFYNFDYFIRYFDLVEEWLLSDDFYKKYKKENHPYPPLLDPRKLNDKNEIINYSNISAKLAWKINLPLPHTFKFLFWGSHGVGNEGLMAFLKLCGLKPIFYKFENDSLNHYYHYYYELLNITDECYVMMRNYIDDINSLKFYYLFPLDMKLLNLTRDPISVLKSFSQVQSRGKNYINMIDLEDNYKYIFNNRVSYLLDMFGFVDSPQKAFECDFFNRCVDGLFCNFHDSLLATKLKVYFNNQNSIIINMDQILPETAFSTLVYLAKIFDFKKPSDDIKYLFLWRVSDYTALLPLYIKLPNKDIVLSVSSKYFVRDDYVDISDLFLNNIQTPLTINIEQKYYFDLKKDVFLIKRIKKYLKILIKAFKEQLDIEKKKKIDEYKLLYYLQNNSTLRKKFKKRLDNEHLPYIKQHRPDIVASWKYYQEFEKMCEELDKKE